MSNKSKTAKQGKRERRRLLQQRRNNGFDAKLELYQKHLPAEEFHRRVRRLQQLNDLSKEQKKNRRDVLKEQYKVCNNQHTFVASVTELLEIECIRCGKPAHQNLDDNYQTLLLKYLSGRRKRRVLENLFSLVVPLDASSFVTLHRLASDQGIRSNTTTLHVTLLEGVVCPENGIQNIPLTQHTQILLQADPSVSLQGFRTIPSTTLNCCLVVATVQLQSLDARNWLIRSDKQHGVTRLPQWDDLHIALGLIEQEREMFVLNNLVRALETYSSGIKWLRVNPDFLALLPSQQHQLGVPAMPESSSGTLHFGGTNFDNSP